MNDKGKKRMLRKLMVGALASAAIVLSTAAFAQGTSGAAAEAKAMLEKAVAAVKADKAKAIDMFKKGEGGFKDRDLYPFCANSGDGIINAAPAAVIGKDMRTLKDKNGKEYGKEMYDSAKEGTFVEVSYMWPRPGTDTTPVQKVSFVTKVADQVCAVGYYK